MMRDSEIHSSKLMILIIFVDCCSELEIIYTNDNEDENQNERLTKIKNTQLWSNNNTAIWKHDEGFWTIGNEDNSTIFYRSDISSIECPNEITSWKYLFKEYEKFTVQISCRTSISESEWYIFFNILWKKSRLFSHIM